MHTEIKTASLHLTLYFSQCHTIALLIVTWSCSFNHAVTFDQNICPYEDFKLEKEPTDKAKEPDPGGSDQQNLGFKKLKNRKTDRTVGLN